MSPEEQAGGSFVRFEPPDICFAAFVGDIDATLMLRMNEELRRVAHDRPYIFLLLDHSRTGSVSAEARRLATEGSRNLRIEGCASFGASFTVRVLVSLAARVHALFRKEAGPVLSFFRDEAEARAWIEVRRRALDGTTRPTNPPDRTR
jgi:hypothetical protein